MDNSTATRPYSKLKGDPYRAYEALPAEVRRALQEALVDWCPLRAREMHLRLLRERGLRPAQAAAALVQAIRGHDQAEVAAFARAWAKGAAAYPHLAAGATLQRYEGAEGMPAAEAVPLVPVRALAKGAQPDGAQAMAGRPKGVHPKGARARVAQPKAPGAKGKRAKAPGRRKAGRRGRR